MHTTSIRVYLEDTDAGGIVYHANYIRFAERARTELVRSLGFSQHTLMTNPNENDAILFAVVSLDIQFKKTALLDDLLQIRTYVKNITKTKIYLEQLFWKENLKIAQLNCVIACVKKTGKPVGIPLSIKERFQKMILENSSVLQA